MIIDCHTHLGRNKHINATADQLLKSMDKAGIDKSLVFAGELNDAPNEWVLEQIAPHRDRLFGVAAYTPPIFGSPHSVEYAQQVIANLYGEGKIVAVKFYTGYDHYYPIDVSNVLCALQEVGCPAIFHSGDCLNSVKSAKLKYAHPLHIDEVAVDYPNINFVIAHMGFPWVRDAAEVCYKNKNVFADCSGFVYGKFTDQDYGKFYKTLRKFYDIAPMDKLLFGTDFPISDHESYLDAFNWIDRDNMAQNAQRVFKLQ